MRLYFKNRRSPKAYKVIISSQENSHIGFIGAVTNPTMKIGNGVVQFYLAPIASKGTWTINEDYHFKDGNLTLMAYKNLNYTSYNSHATYSDFTPNIQKALSYIEFHNFETISDSVRIITGLSDATWMYDQENNKFLFLTETESGSLTPLRIANQINLLLNSDDSVLKYNAELFVKELILDLFKPSPKGLLSDSLFSSSFRNNAVITVLGEDEYKDTYLDSNTTSSLNFSQGFTDRIPSTNWYAEGNGQIVEGGEAFSHTVFKTSKDVTDSLQTPSKLLTGGSIPFTLSFDLLIKEDQVDGDFIPLLSKNKNTVGGDQCLYVSADGRLVFERKINVGGNHILPVTGLRRIEYNTKFTIKLVYDGNMFKVFVNDVLDLQFGSIVGIHTDTDQPYRFMNNLVPSYIDYRSVTNGFIDNIQVQDGVALDPTKEYDAYQENLVSQLRFQGQVGKTSFVDEANDQIKWMGYGDAKLVEGSELGLYSYLSLDGMGSYIKTLDSDPFKFNNKFTIHFKFKTSTTSKLQILFDRYASQVPGSFQISINPTGSLVFTKGAIPSYIDLVSSTTNLNNGSINTIDIIKDGESLSMYINGFLDTMFDVTGDVFNADVPVTAIGAQVNTRNESYDFKGNIYEYSIYKGVAVYPEIKAKELDKVELNFDTGSPVDIYGNSTWTNNGVTFDQVNSVKGRAAYFDGNALGIKSGISDNLNFENKNFIIDFDFKAIELGRQYGSTIITSTQVGGYTSFSVSIPNDSTTIVVNTTNDNMSAWGVGLASFGTSTLSNDYRNINISRFNNSFILKDNDVVRSIANINTSQTLFNLNGGNDTIIGTARNDLVGTKFKGYVDNFKSIKNYQEPVIIDKPAVHLPLETNAINTGFTPLTINSVGSPTYTTFGDKKCIKFESGKYLTVNANNIFNLGNNSDFYMEFDICVQSFLAEDNYPFIISMGAAESRTALRFNKDHKLFLYTDSGNNIFISDSSTIFVETKWYNIKLFRKQNQIALDVDGNTLFATIDDALDFSVSNTNIGGGTFYSNISFNGYMSNFKMFVGTSEIPETYNDKTVLDLDFKPTYKSYLFKDNYNKCVIHPVNITQRDYQDSQYCCAFNGIDQYLQLGYNDLLNFGFDDFVINVKFRKSINSILYGCLIANGQPTSTSMDAIMIRSDNTISIRMNQTAILSATDINISDTNINDLTIIRSNGLLTILLNGVNTNIVDQDANYDFNLNRNSNTYIGKNNWDGSNGYFQGNIYSIKVLRNTTDLSLLDKSVLVPEDPGDGIIIDGPPPLEKGILRFWEERKEIDPHNVVLEFKQLRLSD